MLHATRKFVLRDTLNGTTQAPLRNARRTQSNTTTSKYPKVLVSIHGYPRRYNAGSEVYTQTLALGLSQKGVPVSVFAREEDPFKPDYVLSVETDPIDPSIFVHLVNHARSNIRYANEGIDAAFEKVLHKERPDIVHMGHLNHLSTGLVKKAKDFGAKVVFTLHDFWMMCPRGQFLETGLDGGDPWKLCTGQDDTKCATKCMNRFHTGEAQGERHEQDEAYWKGWVHQRMRTVTDACRHVDLFIAPSEHLQRRFVDDFHLPVDKIKYVDYGFDLSRLPSSSGRKNRNDTFVFGYIGRHHPSKGIDMLIKAFYNITGEAKLIVWGRSEGQLTSALKRITEEKQGGSDKTVEWRSEYRNEAIVQEVFEHCDCIVVPSIWDENSPLVIHEAQQVRIPVITAEYGGMAEFVKNRVNGLTFEHRNQAALGACLQEAIDKPTWIKQLGGRGYLKSEDGNIPSSEQHVDTLLSEYKNLLPTDPSQWQPKSPVDTPIPAPVHTTTQQTTTQTATPMSTQKPSSAVLGANPSLVPPPLPLLIAPWRITFDTNPDDCNLKCTMCEEHSIFSKSQEERKAAGIKRRRMDIDTIRKVVAECAPKGLREIIPSTMGEPLMYKHFPDIIEICKTYNVKLNLTTNGTFLGRGVQEWGHMILPVASDVKISWNGATKETSEKVMVGSRFDTQLANLREFLRIRDETALATGNRASITLQLTFMQVNLKEIPEVVRLAVSLGVDRVKGHHLWAHFKEIKDQNMRRNEGSIKQWNEIVSKCEKIAKENPLPNGKTIVLENIFALDLNATKEIHPAASCPFLGKEAWVNHAGRFDPCCAPDKERKSLGAFGNVQDGGLLSIWNGPDYKNLVTNYHHQDVCKGCNMRKIAPVSQ